MNAHSSIEPPKGDAHLVATDDVNRWRGRCINAFAAIERACIDTLELLITSGEIPPSRKEWMFKARVAAIRNALAKDGSDRAKKPRKVFSEIEDILNLRNEIVHGLGRVSLERDGHWVWTYEYRASREGFPLEKGFFEQAEAKEIEARLTSKTRSLVDTLRNFRSTLEKRGSAKPV